MFVKYHKFKTEFPGSFNSFSIHSESLVTAVFHQVIVPNSFHWYRLKNKLFQNFKLKYLHKHRQNLIKLAPYLKHILLNKEKVIESFSFGVYSRILMNKIDKIGLTLTMFVEYQKLKTAFPGLFNSFLILSEAWVTA